MELNRLDEDQLQVVTTEVKSACWYQANGDEISWVYVQPKSGTTFTTDTNSHHWAGVGIYSQLQANSYNSPIADGGLSDTMIGSIGTAYNSTGMYVGSLSSETFRTSFYQNLRLTIPVSGGTGSLSGLTSLDVYSAFVSQNDSKEACGNGVCSTYLVDSLHSESHRQSTDLSGIGYAYDPINNPSESTGGQYRSGIVHLFTNSIEFSGATNTGTTWSSGWSGNSRYTYDGGKLAIFDGNTRNTSIGFFNLDSGLVYLYHPDVVNNFNTGIATGGTVTSGLTFNTSDCNGWFRDRDFSTKLEINVNLAPNTFTESLNPSKLDAKANGIECDNLVKITDVCFYNDANQLVAMGKLSEPLTKLDSNYSLMNASISLDGGVKSDPCDDTYRATVTLPN
jgi:hypothetical protein